MSKRKKDRKVAFPKADHVIVFDCNEHEIHGLDPEQEDNRLTISFWLNPSKAVIQSLARFVLATDEELVEMSESDATILIEDFYVALSNVIVSTNIAELDFSTPEKAEISYKESPGLPWGFVHEAVATWMITFIQEHLDLKKVLRLLSEPKSSGNEDSEKAQN